MILSPFIELWYCHFYKRSEEHFVIGHITIQGKCSPKRYGQVRSSKNAPVCWLVVEMKLYVYDFIKCYTV